MNDLYQLDLVSLEWTYLPGLINGPMPAARNSHGFAALGGKLYVNCGNDHTFDAAEPGSLHDLSDMQALPFPGTKVWDRPGQAWLIQVCPVGIVRCECVRVVWL